MFLTSPSKKLNSQIKIIIKSSLTEISVPNSASYFWNTGSLLGVCLSVQIFTGILLSIHYRRDISIAFFSIRHISRDVNFGWGLRITHANGARLFFVCIYVHMGRGIYYNSSHSHLHTWIIGTSILLLLIATAFFGYILPWGQMSFWGATVITNLFSAIPFLGTEIVTWLWGGFAVDNATLNRFYSLHFILPFIITACVFMHLFFLHLSGSGNNLGISNSLDKVVFHPYWVIKDIIGGVGILLCFFFLVIFYPWRLGDPENFINANPLVTPIHIQPEWYFLFAYAILRSIPNKLGGVIALLASVLVFYTIPLIPKTKFKGARFNPLLKITFWSFRRVCLLLIWIGARPVEDPYIFIGQILTRIYFRYFLSFLIMPKIINLTSINSPF